MNIMKPLALTTMATLGLSGCTAVISQGSFFPDEKLTPPKAVLQFPQGYTATDQIFDLGTVGKVRAVRLDNPKSETVVVYSAGNGGFVDSNGTSQMAVSLANVTGADIILYDYPGRGGTTIPATIEAATAFGPAMVDQLKTAGWMGSAPAYAYGLSFGGTMTASMARTGAFAGVIIEGSATDYAAIGRDFVPGLAKPFVKLRISENLKTFDYLGYIVAAKAPVLLLSGTKDKVVRPKRMLEFAEQLKAQRIEVTLRPVPVGHGGALNSIEGRNALTAFIKLR
jgi:pimeloyl-ACP methyl ester carboxylesterase